MRKLIFKGVALAWNGIHAYCSSGEPLTIYSFTKPRCAFLDKSGNLKYWPVGAEELSELSEGIAVYQIGLTNRTAGFIGLDGIPHPHPFVFDSRSRLSSGLALVMEPETGKFCYIDSEGHKKIETGLTLKYPQPCQPFSEGLAAIFVPNNKPTGKRPLDPPSPGMPSLRDGHWGFIDKTGKFAIPAKYASFQVFREDSHELRWRKSQIEYL